MYAEDDSHKVVSQLSSSSVRYQVLIHGQPDIPDRKLTERQLHFYGISEDISQYCLALEEAKETLEVDSLVVKVVGVAGPAVK